MTGSISLYSSGDLGKKPKFQKKKKKNSSLKRNLNKGLVEDTTRFEKCFLNVMQSKEKRNILTKKQGKSQKRDKE